MSDTGSTRQSERRPGAGAGGGGAPGRGVGTASSGEARRLVSLGERKRILPEPQVNSRPGQVNSSKLRSDPYKNSDIVED